MTYAFEFLMVQIGQFINIKHGFNRFCYISNKNNNIIQNGLHKTNTCFDMIHTSTPHHFHK